MSNRTTRTQLCRLVLSGLAASLLAVTGLAGCGETGGETRPPATDGAPVRAEAAPTDGAPVRAEAAPTEGSSDANVAATTGSAAGPHAAANGASSSTEGASGAPLHTARRAPDAAPARARGAFGAEVRGLSLRTLTLTSGIADRAPVDQPGEFAADGERIFAFLDARNDRDEEAFVVVTFEGPDGQRTGHIRLRVPPRVSRWRTWAFTRHATAEGDWTVLVSTEDGETLAAQHFRIAADPHVHGIDCSC